MNIQYKSIHKTWISSKKYLKTWISSTKIFVKHLYPVHKYFQNMDIKVQIYSSNLDIQCKYIF